MALETGIEDSPPEEETSTIIRFIDNLKPIVSEPESKFAVTVLTILLLMAFVGPFLTPYEYNEQQFDAEGDLKSSQAPSLAHPMGTTARGEDVLSRLIYGAQPTMVTGLVGGFLIIFIGTTIGVTAGYVGGLTETILMRFTDFVYGIPIIPFAITLAAIVGTGFWTMIFILGGLLWRTAARVLRAEVLKIRSRAFIESVEALGASRTRIMVYHLLPNIAPMIALYFAMGIGFAILIQAGLTFLGISNPFIPSWGVMIRNAYQSGLLAQAWWWSFPPGILISLTVLSTFLVGRGYERTRQSSETVGFDA